YRPTNPVRPNASSSATPPTTGGSTSGRATRALSMRCPGKLVRASTHASGTPMTTEIAVLTVAVHSERVSAWVASDPLRAAPSLPHGARISNPASGRTRNRIAISAGASKGAGTDRDAPPRAVRRARSRAVRRDGAGRVIMTALDVSSGLLEPRGGEHLLARGGQHVGDKSLSFALVRAAADGSDRVQRRGVIAGRDRHALDLGPGRLHVGHVHHARADVAEFDLGQHRLHVRLERDRLDGDPGVLEYLRGQDPARHLGLAQGHLD